MRKPSSLSPGIFLDKAHGHIKGRPAPAFKGIDFTAEASGGVRNLQQIMGANAGSQQGLVSVAHGRIGNKKAFLSQDPVGQPFRTFLEKNTPRPLPGLLIMMKLGNFSRPQLPEMQRLFNAGIAIYYGMANKPQQPGRPVSFHRNLEQLWMVVEIGSIAPAGKKGWMGNNIFQETDIGLNPAYTELEKSSFHVPCRFFES